MTPDTGASGHYMEMKAEQYCTDVRSLSAGPTVTVADGSDIVARKSASIPLSSRLSKKGQSGLLFDNFGTNSLLSIGQLCDDGCKAVFEKEVMHITKDKEVILTGPRNRQNGLWKIKLPAPASKNVRPYLQPRSDFPLPMTELQPPQQIANGIILNQDTRRDMAQYFHATNFSPTRYSFLRAIDQNHYDSWPAELKGNLIKKHLPKSEFTSLGHLRGQQKNIKSTKKNKNTPPVPQEGELLDLAPPQEYNNTRTRNVFVSMVSTKELRKSASDQTGRFPVTSSRGNNYIFFLYDYDSNIILAKALKSRKGPEITAAWKELFDTLKYNGYAPELHILDNECSEDMKKAFRKNNVDFQLVPAYIHRRNPAERAIQTGKNHFCSCIASVDPNFPITEWCRLIPQFNITLNLLRSSRRQPNLSAYACIYGNFNFNRTPLAPPGTRVIVHETPNKRKTFGAHGIPGWYVGPSLDHYRLYKCYLPSTANTRDAITVDWFPHQVPFPKVNTETYLRQSAEDMLAILQNEKLQSIPSLNYGSRLTNAYIEIAKILGRAIDPPPPLNITPPIPAETPVPTPNEAPRVQPAAPQRVTESPQRVRVTPQRVLEPIIEEQPLLTPVEIMKQNKPSADTSSAYAKQYRPMRERFLQHRYKTRSAPPTYAQRAQFSARKANFIHSLDKIQRKLAANLVSTGNKTNAISPTSGKQGSIKKLIDKWKNKTWTRSLSNEFGRLLSNGIGASRPPSERVKGTGTIFFIDKTQVPSDRKITYANFVCNIRPQKEETHRVRLTAGGDKLDYPDDPSSPAVSMLDTKIHLNSTISRAHLGAKYMCIDIKNFYLGTPMKYFQYMRIKADIIPAEVYAEYDVPVNPDGYVYVEIRRGMYGLKEAGKIAFDQLVKKLAPFGYSPVEHTPGVWKHKTRKTVFTLCVDDFGVQYFSQADANHLINALQSSYECTIDWEGRHYCGFTLDWHYAEGYVDVSMPGYVPKALTKFGHPRPKRKQFAPHKWTAPVYGRRTAQLPTPASSAPLLDEHGKKRVQQVSGSFSFYGRGVDPTTLPALNEISTQQSAPTTDTEEKCNMLIDYLWTYPNAVLRFYASDMILYIEADSAYLVLPEARSRAAAHFYFSNSESPPNNAPVHTMCKTIKGVMSSAAEAETGGIYMGGKEGIPIRTSAIEMGHPQPTDGTKFKTDNSTARGILTKTLRQKLSKSFDMRFYWMRDRIKQKMYNLIWEKGATNQADYFTKHFPPTIHRQRRWDYIQKMPDAPA